MRKTTRFLLILLALAMIFSTFAACATEDDDVTESSNEDGTVASGKGSGGGEQNPDDPWADWPRDENGYLMDTLPENMNFEDEFLFYVAENQKWHIWADEKAADPLGHAMYACNETVAERLGIELKWDGQRCFSGTEKTNFCKYIETDISSGHEIDGVMSYNLVPYRLANKGLCVNLAETEHIDLEMPWWPEEFLSNMLYKDQIYALVNSHGIGTTTNLSCIFFNNDLLDAKKLESPYDLVEKNEWTIATLKSLIKDTYEDRNQDGSEGYEDVYGLCTSTAARITCWYYGVGIRFSNLDDNGDLVLNTDVEGVTNKLEAVVDLFSTKDSMVADKEQHLMFKEERAYFYLSTLATCLNMVNNNVAINYGVAPNPKLNSEQSRYYTHLPNTHDAWFIPVGVKDEACSSAFIECMASEAYRQVDEVFYETNIKLRYAPDERLAKMYDLVRSSITFDFAYIYKEVTGADIDNNVIKCIQYPEQYKWATVWAGIKDKVETNFQSVLDTYQ